MKQGFGRLIRTHADAGIVALLDGRISRRRYGTTLLASLPRDCPRTESLADVAAFWSRIRTRAATDPPDDAGATGPDPQTPSAGKLRLPERAPGGSEPSQGSDKMTGSD